MFALLSLVSLAVAAPDPCAAIKTKTDAFSGQAARTYLAAGGWQVTELAGSVTLAWTLTSTGLFDLPLPAGTVLKVRVEDGTIVELISKDIALAEKKLVNNAVFTSWIPVWTMTPEVAAKLGQSKPMAMEAEAIGQKWTMVAGYGPGFEKLYAVMGCLTKPAAAP